MLETAKLGQTLQFGGNSAGAVAAYRSALRNGFRSPGLFFNLGSLLIRLGRSRLGVSVLARGLSQYPEHPRLLGAYLTSLLASTYLPESTKAKEHINRVSRAYNPAIERPVFPTHHRLRIGCVSPDFREHPKAFLQFRHFRHFDRKRFELYFYSTRSADDGYNAEARATADHWREAVDLSPDQIASMIKQDEIDILVDVTGHFANSPLPVFALRPAPLQVSLSGYPATTGLPQIDFKIVDHITDPGSAQDAFYAEKLHRLNRPFACYAPAPTAPPVGPSPIERNGFVTFGCFNRRSKINQPILSLWAEILRRTPGSRLLFHYPVGKDGGIPPESRNSISRCMRAGGVSSRRLDFRGYTPLEEHLTMVSSVDIALDTFPYAGMTITFDCLWMGVPVVTLASDAHVSRTGASILSSLNLCDWIANSREQYVEIAVQHAQDSLQLATLRQGLRPALAASPLADGRGYARALENAFLEMWSAVGGPARN